MPFSRNAQTLFYVTILSLCCGAASASESVIREKNLFYYSQDVLEKADEYQKAQCVLDVYAPNDAEKLPVLVWLHGGGLTGGSKDYPKFLRKEAVIIVSVEYRLAPKANFPAFLEDSAAALAWTFAHIEKYGGDPEKVFLGGYSAGGYLSAMVGMDPRWLKAHDISHQRLAGLVLCTAQVTTHFHVKQLLNVPGTQYRPVIDENAPLYYVAKELPPILCVLGDRKIEWKVRVEENEMMVASLKALGHPHAEFHENPGYDHGTLGNTRGDFAPEAAEQIREFLKKVSL